MNVVRRTKLILKKCMVVYHALSSKLHSIWPKNFLNSTIIMCMSRPYKRSENPEFSVNQWSECSVSWKDTQFRTVDYTLVSVQRKTRPGIKKSMVVYHILNSRLVSDESSVWILQTLRKNLGSGRKCVNVPCPWWYSGNDGSKFRTFRCISMSVNSWKKSNFKMKNVQVPDVFLSLEYGFYSILYGGNDLDPSKKKQPENE